jgi:hypothetical protein
LGFHFALATSHGKRSCEALGGTIKRLTHSYTDQIMTPRQLLNWAETNIQNMNFNFVTEPEFREKEEKLLFKRNPAAELLSFMLFCQYNKVN